MVNNIFTRLLKILNIPHTEQYANESFRLQPYRNTMFGLMLLLDKYKIPNECVQFTDKNTISNDLTPMIIALNGRFIILNQITSKTITLTNISGIETEIARNTFLSEWDGTAIIVSPDKNSTEPNFKSHHSKNNKMILKNIILIVCSCLLIISGFLHSSLNNNLFWYIILIINSLGIYITILLLQKQLNLHNHIADRICSIFKETKCENVTNSTGGSLFGFVKLSEVGFVFFLINAIALLFFPNTIQLCGISALIVLPFTFWSLWYQKFVAKSWCMLCLITLFLMWGQAVIYLSARIFNHFSWNWFLAICLATSYILSTLLLNKLMVLIKSQRDAKYWKSEYDNLKVQEEVINAFQQKMPLYDTSSNICSCMVFGNPNARRNITIFSNPYCNPCAKMHDRIKGLPGQDVCIRYVMTSFSEDLTVINKYFIAAYQQLGEEVTWKLMSEWYTQGKHKGTDFFTPYKLNIDTVDVDEELNKQLKWRLDKPFYGTPTILVNGKELGGPYTVEDYMYMPI